MQSFTASRRFNILKPLTGFSSKGSHYIFIVSAILMLNFTADFPQASFPYHSSWAYLKGSAAASLSSSWMNPGFNDSGWTRGNAPFHYGDGTGGVELTDMYNTYTTLYLRSTFSCSSANLISQLHFTTDYDDGFIIWVNGNEALRIHAPGTPSYNSVATANHESGTGENFTVDAASLHLVDGVNTIAVQGFNVSLTSSDFYSDPEVTGDLDIP